MKRPLVMLVDDDCSLLQALPETLSLRIPNIVVEPVPSSRSALEQLQCRKYDALITDLRMPDVDGFMLLQAAKRAQPELSVVMMTGDVGAGIVFQAFKAGAYDIIGKPFDRHEFIDIVRLAIQTRRLALDVKGQQFVLARLTTRLRELERLSPGGAWPGRGPHLQDPERLDRRAEELNHQAILSSRTSLDILKRRARLIETMLGQTKARLASAQEEARRNALLRLHVRGGWRTAIP